MIDFLQLKDFIVVDGHGCVYLIDCKRNRPYILLESQCDIITSLDVHPESDMISLGNEKGQLSMVNYSNCQFTYIKSVSDFVKTEQRVITCIKYTSIGNHLAVGMKSGELFFVDSCLYLPKQEKPFNFSSTSITNICFSPDDSFMAHILIWGQLQHEVMGHFVL
ncbi:cilia- and flagella-associated protein 251-like [Hetaerina americana]|uniref:cilia- and flagella-associated protein 251-like n=1 Tax=Hetaerina americana TaxID=62018 RepID=UPI003A7F1592